MGLPSELRCKIYPYLLVKALDGFVEYCSGQPPLPGMNSALAVGPRDCVAIMMVTRTIYQEAIGVLYGENKFRSFYAASFAHDFIEDVMPRTNAALIRHLTIGVPMINKHERETWFVDWISDTLPGLESMALRVLFEYAPSKGTFPWSVEKRSILCTAADITNRHPRLKKATMLACSGGELADLTSQDSLPSS
jgi:hypothetical protein